MAIKAGQILHDANGFVVDRIQTGGAGNLNIPEERIYELGNYQTVATVRDTPDLSFDLESLDVSTEIEAILTGEDPTTTADGDMFSFLTAKPMDVLSPFKSTQGAYNIVRGLALPYLTLESAAYRFGINANASQAYTLRGDSIFYIPGTPYYEEYPTSGTPAGPYTLSNTALPYEENGVTRYVLAVCYIRADGSYRRCFRGADYTDTATSFTFTAGNEPPAGATVKAVYGSATAASYLQAVHETVAVKPAAVRGKDIDVYIGDVTGTTFTRWTGVQGFEANWRVTLDNDEEFGNPYYVSQDYDTAEVAGTVTVRPRDPQDLWAKIHEITGIATTEVVGANNTLQLPIELRVTDPDTDTRIKTLYIPDARFQVPAIQGRVQTKLEVTFNWTSDGGLLEVYAGERP